MITPEDIKDLSFEASLRALEAIIETISSDKPELDEIIKLYEDGVVYLNQCRIKLQEAEAKLIIIGKDSHTSETENNNGS